MPKSKVRNVVSVEVDDVQAAYVEPSWREERDLEIERRKTEKIHLGPWWDFAAGLIFVGGLASIVVSWTNVGTKSEFVTALTMIVAAVVFSGFNGRLYGKEPAWRETLGWSFLGMGLLCIAGSFVFRSSSAWAWLLAAGLALVTTGWGLRRLVGESFLRSTSMGLAMFVPFFVLENGLVPVATLNSFIEFLNQSTLWYTGVFAEMWRIPFAPTADGIRFAGGEINSAAAFDNFAGIMSAVGFSLALSIAARHSLILSCIGLMFAACWWLVFRSTTCVGIADNHASETYLNEQALSIVMFFSMLLVIAATNLGLGAVASPIPLANSELDQAPLTLLYNFAVSFPQFGPSSEILGLRSRGDSAEHYQAPEDDDDD